MLDAALQRADSLQQQLEEAQVRGANSYHVLLVLFLDAS